MDAMSDASQPRWRRRKTARPSEIAEAAFEVFAEKGFAAARLDEIAARAGVSKGALYLYFETKEELFRAAVSQAVAPNLQSIAAMADAYSGPFAELAPVILWRLAVITSTTRIPAVAKTVIGESRNFPDLAMVWHDTVVSPALGMIAGVIARAQARGEVKPGEPRLYALSLVGPMLAGFLWREVLVPVGAEPIDALALAEQHARTVLYGMLAPPAAAP